MVDLNGRRFSPLSNSEGGRVKSDAVFVYSQNEDRFTAVYSGEGVSDGHIIGQMTGERTAGLVYHSRSDAGALEAGRADVTFTLGPNNKVIMDMSWQWLNGTGAAGTSRYEEI